MTLIVESVGPQATVQDLGRPGYADVGVPTGGAADRGALTLANRLVGNPDGACGLELLMGNAVLLAEEPVVVAVTGAPASVSSDDRAMPFGEAFLLQEGDRLRIGTPVAGLRTYVGVRGGIDEPRTLGSRSTSPTANIGPEPLQSGRRLPVADAPDSVVPEPFPGQYAWTNPVTFRVLLGPRDDWFTDDAVRILLQQKWTTSSDLDRVGVRLEGPPLERSRCGELASEGMVRGAIQVPPNGQPVVFLADHPTTGGYPVIAVVTAADTDRLAQLRPGDTVRFTL